MDNGITLLLETIYDHAKKALKVESMAKPDLWRAVFPGKKSVRDLTKVLTVEERALLVFSDTESNFEKYEKVKDILHQRIFQDYFDSIALCDLSEIPWACSLFVDQLAEVILFDFSGKQDKRNDFLQSCKWLLCQLKESQYNPEARAMYLSGLLECMMMATINGPGDYLRFIGFDPLRGDTPSSRIQPSPSIDELFGRVSGCRLFEIAFINGSDNYNVAVNHIDLRSSESAVIGCWDAMNEGSAGEKKISVRPFGCGKDETVSRNHCILWHDGEGWLLEDCSTNGTEIIRRSQPTRRIHRGVMRLELGDAICLSRCSTGFLFQYQM